VARTVREHTPRVVIVRDVAEARIPTTRLRTTLTHLLQAEKSVGAVNVIVINDAAMRRLNRRFRDRDKSTDVLSFPMGDPMPGSLPMAVIGEIYCNYSHCQRWVKENGGTIADELLRLAVHGCLHLLGYDHHDPADHRKMLRAENRYLDAGGLILSRVNADGRREHA
jgi:probable rRNA maturation factor